MTLQSDSASPDDRRPMQLPSPCPPLFPGPGRSGTATPQQQSHSGFFKQFTTTGGENVSAAHVIDREQCEANQRRIFAFFSSHSDRCFCPVAMFARDIEHLQRKLPPGTVPPGSMNDIEAKQWYYNAVMLQRAGLPVSIANEYDSTKWAKYNASMKR